MQQFRGNFEGKTSSLAQRDRGIIDIQNCLAMVQITNWRLAAMLELLVMRSNNYNLILEVFVITSSTLPPLSRRYKSVAQGLQRLWSL